MNNYDPCIDTYIEAMGHFGRITSLKDLPSDKIILQYLQEAKKLNAAGVIRKEYIEWITEAKTETTRNKRIETTVEWLSEGKNRNWKYAK